MISERHAKFLQEQSSQDGEPKVEVEIVKMEPADDLDHGSPGSPGPDVLDDQNCESLDFLHNVNFRY